MRPSAEASQTWPAQAAWLAATEVTATAYGVDLAELRAASRGRGPRPPTPAREPKKVAIYLTLLLSGASCRALGRQLGLHWDTVASHCAEVREWADDDVVEANIQLLAANASVKLGLATPPAVGRGRSRTCHLARAAA